MIKTKVKMKALKIIIYFIVGMLFLLFAGLFHQEQQNSINNKFYGGQISSLGEDEIPQEFIDIYKDAEKEYNVPWNLLAAHHKVETDFSSITPMVSPVGAVGHMQFMPCTWVGWHHPSCNGLGAGNIPESDLKKPHIIKLYGGYGVDANNDGKADPFDLEDAIHTAANFLSENGASDGNIREAVFEYNHADWYVDQVMGYADKYVDGYIPIENNLDSDGSNKKVTEVGKRWIGNSEYVFGGGRNKSDIQAGRFDCSSFVNWAYDQVGVDLGPINTTSTETLKNIGESVTEDDMKAGDLVFFDTYKVDGHVGIYMGNGEFIGAQSSTGVDVVDMTNGYWKDTFNGRVRRVN